ncbi:MAG: hypothetical protein CMB80_29365 [Flammeovirgaceae bacterium]|nr:hypothetical protein [Flammeovirgaceae bacterium]MBE63105.1 hypothetical protein [Flammeovirgaceae bacterium]
MVWGLIASGQDKVTIYGGMQIWGRYTDLNPGSTIGSNEAFNSLDFSIRRYRIGLKAQPYDYLSFNIQMGNNNLSRYQKDQPPKLLDAYATWHINDKTKLTAGKHAWTGLSRYAAPSTFSNISSDINYSATPSLNVHDDFFRRIAIALHGQVGQLDYRAIVAKPFANSLKPTLTDQATFINEPTAFIYSSYVKYQFFDHESLSSAWSSWSYLGSKKILAIGAGFYQHEKATESLQNGDTTFHSMTSLAIDVFADMPINNRIFTGYIGLINHNFGPKFIRMVGANNPADGSSGLGTLNGKGNSFPITGTGQILFTQLGLGFKMENEQIIQPNISAQFSNFEFVNESMVLIEGGVSYYLDKHQSKLSISAQRRPVLTEVNDLVEIDSYKMMIIGQYQIRF